VGDYDHQQQQQGQPASPPDATPQAEAPAPEPAPSPPQLTTLQAHPRVVRSAEGTWIASAGVAARCPPGEVSCEIVATVEVPAGETAAKPLRLGSVHASLDPGAVEKISVPLSGRGAGLLRRRGRMRVTFSVAATARGGAASSTRRAATLRAPPPGSRPGG
jgi:hypothetical protein